MKKIQINNKHAIYYKWIEHDVFFINDLIKENGEFLSFEEFKHKYNINTNVVTYQGLLSAIPRIWKQNIIYNGEKLTNTECKLVSLLKSNRKVAKYFYNLFIMDHKEFPVKSSEKWNEKLEIALDSEDWKSIYKASFLLTDDTNIQTFQFKLLHRTLFTNSRLLKMKIVESGLCTFCLANRETLEHLFWECPFSRFIWESLKNGFESNLNIVFHLTCPFVLLGCNNDPHFDVINFCILLVKKYIYTCRCKNTIPSIEGVKSTLLYYRQIDTQSTVFYTQTKAVCIRERWRSITTALDLD